MRFKVPFNKLLLNKISKIKANQLEKALREIDETYKEREVTNEKDLKQFKLDYAEAVMSKTVEICGADRIGQFMNQINNIYDEFGFSEDEKRSLRQLL